MARYEVFSDTLATAPPFRRRPRRADVVTYRARIDLKDTKPPLWRRLELASDLYLNEVHEVIQAAFGWTDSHLHEFASGPSYYSHEAEHYLCPFEVDEGKVGVPEEQVRLDEVLADAGDRLFYAYDFGDDWQHVIMLEAVLPRDGSAPRAMCTAGRRPGPPEDCGGVHGYELIEGATDPTRPDHAENVADFVSFYGDDIDPEWFRTTPFDVDQINRALAELGIERAMPELALPEALEELVNGLRTTADRRRLRRLIADAELHAPIDVDEETAGRMVGPYQWLLDRVGPDGIKLTAAGYLPPAHVEAAVIELGFDEIWIGKGNRESQTMPVLHLRESAQRLGLLRKHRGGLTLTARGRMLRTDPVGLWWHLAARMPLKSRDPSEEQAGLLLLVAVAAEATADLDGTIARFLDAMGWMSSGGVPLTDSMAFRATWDTRAVLRRLGALTGDDLLSERDQPTAAGVTFARAALRTWPDGSKR